MLLYRSHWQNAFEQNPHREARLLYFAGTPDSTTPPDPDGKGEFEMDENMNVTRKEKTGETEDSKTEADVQNAQEDARKRYEATLSAEKTTSRTTIEQEHESATETDASGEAIPTSIPNTADTTDDSLKTDAKEESHKAAVKTAEAKEGLKFDDMLVKARKLEKKMAQTQASIREVLAHGKHYIPPALQKQLTDDEQFFSEWGLEIINHIEVIETLQNWNKGDLAPEMLLDHVKNKWNATAKANALEAYFKNAKMDSDPWESRNKPTQFLIINGANIILEKDVLLSEYDQLFDRLEKTINTSPILVSIKEIQDRLEKDAKDSKMQKSIWETATSVEWYSIMNVYNGAKEWFESWQDEWKSSNRVKQDRIGFAFGKALQWLPYASGSVENLEQKVDKNNDEEVDKYMKYLKNWGYNYDQLFRPGGVFEKNYGDANRARAILDYAATKGFIYDLDEKWLGKKPEEREFFGHTMEELFSSIWPGPQGKERMNQYFKKLQSKQREGERDQRESGKNQVDIKDDAEIIITQMDAELRSGNLFKAVGMAEVAMRKGKEGEISAHVTTTILRAFRDSAKDPKAKVKLHTIVVESFFEELGKMGMGHPGHTIVQLKLAKKTLKENIGTKFEDAGEIAKIITAIEQDINAKVGKKIKKQELDHLVARVLAAQTVTLSGGKVSIFDNIPEYNIYRRQILDSTYSSSMRMDADEDYYGGAESEILLIPASQVISALSIAEGGARFQYPDRTANFMKLILNRNDELANDTQMAGAYRKFQDEMREKMTPQFSTLLTVAGSGPLSKVTAKVGPEKNAKDEKLFAALIARGLIDPSILEPYVVEGKEASLGYMINEQLPAGMQLPIRAAPKKP